MVRGFRFLLVSTRLKTQSKSAGIVERRLAPFAENISEAMTACLVTMVQANLLALSFGHLFIALKTGIIAGTITSILLVVMRTDRLWIVSVLLGTITAAVDFFVHSGQFGPLAMEAIVTGLGAALLSYSVGMLVRGFRRMLGTARRRAL
jgi:hypothetical protein